MPSTWPRSIGPRRGRRRTRAVAPLRQADGALVIDTGQLDVAACVDAMVVRLDQARCVAGSSIPVRHHALDRPPRRGRGAEGREHVPRDGAFIVVANHCSNFDPPFFGWAVGHAVGRVVHFMAKIEMRTWPIIGWLATQSGIVLRAAWRKRPKRAALLASRHSPLAGRSRSSPRARDRATATCGVQAGQLPLRSGPERRCCRSVSPASHRLFPDGSRIPHATRLTVRIGESISLPHQPSGRIARGPRAGNGPMHAAVRALLPPAQQ